MSEHTPVALEPIPLEPIALEPIALEPLVLEPLTPEAAPEPAKEVLPSTSDFPALSTFAPASPPPEPVAPVAEVPSGPAMGKPKLRVVRGQRMDVVYPLYPGKNYLGRTDDKPVDVDLEDQEAADRIWTSRQHSVITVEATRIVIEDLNSLNGTFVNRARVHPGEVRELKPEDVIQVGTVHMKVEIS